MEIREIAACGISEKIFAIECEAEDLPHLYRILRYVQAEDGYYDEEFLEELKEQMDYICGDSTRAAPPDDIDLGDVKWTVDGDVYSLVFTETTASSLYAIFDAVEERKDAFDLNLDRRLMAQIKELAPSILDNLPVINR
jgi:hypothetical protein